MEPGIAVVRAQIEANLRQIIVLIGQSIFTNHIGKSQIWDLRNQIGERNLGISDC